MVEAEKPEEVPLIWAEGAEVLLIAPVLLESLPVGTEEVTPPVAAKETEVEAPLVAPELMKLLALGADEPEEAPAGTEEVAL